MWSRETLKKFCIHKVSSEKLERLVVSHVLMKQIEDLCDEQVNRLWINIPYCQYLLGETHFQWKHPAATSELNHFQNRIYKERFGTSIKVVDRSLKSKDRKGRCGYLYHGPGKKHHLSHRFKNGIKSHWQLKEHCETGRDTLKTELFESYFPSPSSGIEP